MIHTDAETHKHNDTCTHMHTHTHSQFTVSSPSPLEINPHWNRHTHPDACTSYIFGPDHVVPPHTLPIFASPGPGNPALGREHREEITPLEVHFHSL